MLFGQCPHGGGDKLKGASLTAKMIIITIKMMMTQTKRGVPTVVDHWLKAIADMMSHTLTIGISMVINIITMLKKWPCGCGMGEL